MKVKACTDCGLSIEAKAFDEFGTGVTMPLALTKCPICGSELVDDDSENYNEGD